MRVALGRITPGRKWPTMGEPVTVRGRRPRPIPVVGRARPIPVVGAATPIPVVGQGWVGPSCDYAGGASRRYGESAGAYDARSSACFAETRGYMEGGGGIVEDEGYAFDWNLLASTFLQYEQLRRMSDAQRRGLVDAYRGGASPDELRLMASAKGENTLLYIALAFLGYKVITAPKNGNAEK